MTDIKVVTTFSSSAAQTIHDYLANAIPAFLSKDNLSLVNTTTGAIEAGAAIGEFMDLSTGAIYEPKVTTWGAVVDPLNGKTYASPEAAGFPVGSGVTPSGAIIVPQAQFLGWTAAGLPQVLDRAGRLLHRLHLEPAVRRRIGRLELPRRRGELGVERGPVGGRHDRPSRDQARDWDAL